MSKQLLPDANHLSSHHCVPCEGGVDPLTPPEYAVYLPQVAEWNIVEGKVLEREFTLKNFLAVIAFINEIAEVAESEGHHPDLFLYDYKKLRVTLSTHAIHGLSVNDFVLAVKINQLSLF